MYIGTHNSGTSEKLVWWQRPFAFILNLFSKCQNRSITQQLIDGVKVFNFQVTKYKNKWTFSHGLCIYDSDVALIITKLKIYASAKSPIYFNLYLDKNFFTGQNVNEFNKFVEIVKTICKGSNVHLLYAWVEGTNDYPYINNNKIELSEKYWTLAWSKTNAKTWVDKLPLPKRHAKKYNHEYIANNNSKYLMLDFYEYK